MLSRKYSRIGKTLNLELSKLNNWFSANKLSSNVAKTNYMIFKNTKMRTDINVTIDETNITEVKVTKFLGIMVYNRLSWKNHINVLNKLSKTTAIMYHASRFLNQNTLRTIYCSLFLPYLDYCSEIWGKNYLSNLNKIYLAQKKVIRLICSAKRLDNTNPLFKHLNLLKFNDSITIKSATTINKAFHNCLPQNILSSFHYRFI